MFGGIFHCGVGDVKNRCLWMSLSCQNNTKAMSEHIMGSCHDNVAIGKSSLIDATSLENTSNCDKMDAWGSFFFPSPEFIETNHQCSMFKDSSDEARHVTWPYIVYV